MSRLVVRLVFAVLMTAAAGLGVSAPAQAASCSTAHGVTVVVDFHQLGGGAQSACDAAGGGKTALQQLADTGHALSYVQRQPGFVCRVDGAPASDPCVNTPPADAYWSLWWSDGKSGRWTYSSAGVGALQVPDGGYVALSWQGGSGRATPRVTPAAHPSAPPSTPPASSPTRGPSSSPSSHPASRPTAPPTSSGPAGTSTGSPDPSRSPASTPAVRHHPSRSPDSTPQSSRTAVPATAEATGPPDTSAPASGSGLPGWVAPAVVGALFVAAGAVAVVRRNRAGGA